MINLDSGAEMLGICFPWKFQSATLSCKECSSHVLQCHFWIDSLWGPTCRPSTLSRALIPSPLATVRLSNIEPKDPKASSSAIAGGKQIAVVKQDIMPWFSARVFSRALLFELTASCVPVLSATRLERRSYKRMQKVSVRTRLNEQWLGHAGSCMALGILYQCYRCIWQLYVFILQIIYTECEYIST